MIKIRQFITGWNQRKHPFIWTKPADLIIAKINRKRKPAQGRTTSGASLKDLYGSVGS